MLTGFITIAFRTQRSLIFSRWFNQKWNLPIYNGKTNIAINDTNYIKFLCLLLLGYWHSAISSFRYSWIYYTALSSNQILLLSLSTYYLKNMQVAGFLVPSYDQLAQLQEIVSIEIRYLGSQRIDFEAYTNRQIQTLMSKYTNAFDFILLESSQTTLAGHRAHKIDCIFTYKRNNRYMRSIEFWTIEKDRSYHISYETYSLDYLTLLPVIQKMITSFQILV